MHPSEIGQDIFSAWDTPSWVPSSWETPNLPQVDEVSLRWAPDGVSLFMGAFPRSLCCTILTWGWDDRGCCVQVTWVSPAPESGPASWEEAGSCQVGQERARLCFVPWHHERAETSLPCLMLRQPEVVPALGMLVQQVREH